MNNVLSPCVCVMISYTEYFQASWVRQTCTSLTRETLLLREVEGPGGEEDKAGQKVRRGYIVRVKASLNPLCIPWTMPGPMHNAYIGK